MKYKNNILYILVVIIVGSFVWIIDNKTKTNFCEICPKQNYSVFTSGERLYVGCAGDADSLDLRVVDPDSHQTLKIFPMDGLVKKVIYVVNDDSLLVLLSELDGIGTTHEGKIIKIEYDNGYVLATYEFLNNMPIAMVTNSNQEYVYVIAGLVLEYEEYPPKVYKLRVEDLSYVNSHVIDVGSSSIAITNDDSKLYINDGGLMKRQDVIEGRVYNVEYFFLMSVFSPDLTEVNYIEMNQAPVELKMGYDNRLFVGLSCPYEDNDCSMFVIDTSADQIVNRLTFMIGGEKAGTNFIAIDEYAHLLYSTAFDYGYWDNDFEAYVHDQSSKILKVDLDDYTYEIIETNVAKLWHLEILRKQCKNRIFLTTDTWLKRIIYIDDEIDHNDPYCVLTILSPMPYIGQSPALIEFLAEASDPDNDPLTYHWDFNGDGIYDDPVYDSYTGDPWNPTHAFTESGVHEVSLKVTDSCNGECISIVAVTIEFV